MNRLIGWLTGVDREPQTHSNPHFHAGQGPRPAACFDARCQSPRLDI